MIKLKEIQQIALKVVKQYPYQEGAQLNGFCYAPNFDLDNWGKDMHDYKEGEFWTRAWTASGANENTLAAEYPMCYMKARSANHTLPNYAQGISIQFGFADIDNCKEGENCKKTDAVFFRNLLNIAKNFMSEFSMHVVQNIGGSDVWVTKDEMLANSQPYNESYARQKNALIDLMPKNITYNPQSIKDKTFEVFCVVEFKVCDDVIGFNYKFEDTEGVPVFAPCSEC